MAAIDLNLRKRRNIVHVTEVNEIDPLRDRVLYKLMRITEYTNYTITENEEGRPDIVSDIHYGTDDYWWAILAFNGFTLFTKFKKGITIRIPTHGALLDVLNKATVTALTQSRIVEI